MTSNTKNDPSAVTHNVVLRRFELQTEGHAAFAHYIPESDNVVFDHTFVPTPLRGKGVGTRLVRAALDEARQRHWKIVPRCSFVAAFIERHPQYGALVARQKMG